MQGSTRTSAALLLLALSSHFAFAQTKTPEQQLLMARAFYYTPTASGLRSLGCRVSIDWKGMLSNAGGTPLTDDNPVVKYLNSVHMSVSDDLRKSGKLEWNNTALPPKNAEDAISKMQGGISQMVEGFFQSWNAYVNGSMVPVPDKTTILTRSDTGIHLRASSGTTTIDEDFDKNMLLTKARVLTDQMDVIASPTFTDTPDGRVISSIHNEIRQPPTAPPAYATIGVTYQTVSNRRIPQTIHYDIQNVMQLDLNLSECIVSNTPLQEVTAKP